MIKIHCLQMQKMIKHAKECQPEECCGILVGKNQRGKRVAFHVQTENAARLRARDRFLIGGRDIFRVDKQARKDGMEILGFYHSHPNGSPIPSVIDLKLAWEGYSYLLISLNSGETPEFKSWVLSEDRAEWVEEKVSIVGTNHELLV